MDAHRNHPIGYKYACSVPAEHCQGNRIQVSAGLRGTGQSAAHDTPQGAFKWHKAYLVRQGYTVVDSRCLRAPSAVAIWGPSEGRQGPEVDAQPGAEGAREAGRQCG